MEACVDTPTGLAPGPERIVRPGRHRGQVLRLLLDTCLLADNNEAERSVRMCKLSGTFRTGSP